MGRLERYVFRQASSAFILCLSALTALVWMSQALRELDLVTLKGQGLTAFFLITGLALPLLILAIAPISLFVAVLYTLNRLNADSELVVMAASGASRARIARPFVILSLIVACLSAFLSLYAAPASMAALRVVVMEVRADIISSVVREGVFTEMEQGLTFHIREKGQDGALLGLLVNDERDPKRAMAYLAERGEVTETPQGAFLVMRDGAIHRREAGRADATIIVFQSYAIDLAQFAPPGGEDIYFKPRERSTWRLAHPDSSEPNFRRIVGKIRGELHDRFSAPLYPIAFTFLALAFLGEARTNRQSRFSAILSAVLAMIVLRGIAFGLSSLVVADAAATPLVYAAPLLAVAASVASGRRGGLSSLFAGWGRPRLFARRAPTRGRPHLEGAE